MNASQKRTCCYAAVPWQLMSAHCFHPWLSRMNRRDLLLQGGLKPGYCVCVFFARDRFNCNCTLWLMLWFSTVAVDLTGSKWLRTHSAYLYFNFVLIWFKFSFSRITRKKKTLGLLGKTETKPRYLRFTKKLTKTTFNKKSYFATPLKIVKMSQIRALFIAALKY